MALLHRRDWLKAVLAGSAGALFPFGTSALAASLPAPEPRADAEPEPEPEPIAAAAPEGPPPLWLLEPLVPGSAVGSGWSIAELSPVVSGAAVLTLAHAEHGRARVHLCRRDGAGRGIAQSSQLDFMLMNGSDGATPSDEALGLVILSIAKRVERNERLAGEELRSLQGLLPHAERVRLFGAAQEILT